MDAFPKSKQSAVKWPKKFCVVNRQKGPPPHPYVDPFVFIILDSALIGLHLLTTSILIRCCYNINLHLSCY